MSRHILVVDDDPQGLAVLKEIFAELGFQVMGVGSGDEATALLESDAPIDLVVTDVYMPGVTGLDVFQAARKRDPHLPVLYITGFIPPPLQEILAKASRTLVLQKPFELSALLRALDQVIPLGAGGAPAREAG
ncbi:response regulator [Bordetella sp. N]|uniref:response regulator n=1 Tax=Bordetella sp. N TaxID=1746199 RepID=UPI0012E3F11D|nr:response regulator [Bordetella sp. N]